MQQIDHLKFAVLDGKFQIYDKLDEGTFGQIYNGVNLHKMVTVDGVGQVPQPVIIKFSQTHLMNDSEYKSLTDIMDSAKNSKKENNIAQCFSTGRLIVKDRALKDNMKRQRNPF